ncbi:transcription termination factor MTERF15, mitochondrial [Trifolium repens]|nr:transcription termination factor MTERF15, mitochondrial [Trifolium repens]
MLKFFTTTALVPANTNLLVLFTAPSSSSCSISKHHHYSSIFKFSTTSTTFEQPQQSFTISYLINNCGFTPQTASKASQILSFSNSQKPDSVLAFFTTHGFSNSQIRGIVKREPRLLSLNPNNVLLPKFQFLLSKGVSNSDLIHIVNANPRFLRRSLQNHIIPNYECAKGLLQSDKKIIACVKRYSFLSQNHLPKNVKLLLDNGVSHSNIARLLQWWPSIFESFDLLDTVEELKQLGFDSKTSPFSIAFLAKKTVTKAKWDEKVEIFKKWGWSDEHILQAFKKQPFCMLSSPRKMNAVMNFWVNHLGFDSLDLARAPGILQLSLEKRIIPRGLVVQFLNSKGLRQKDASIHTPFRVSEKLFLEKFVNRFAEHSSDLLKLYEEKMNLGDSRNGLQMV